MNKYLTKAWGVKLLLCLGVALGGYLLLPYLINFSLDNQVKTSIQSYRYYWSSRLLKIEAEGSLSSYRFAYQNLSPAQQEQMRLYSKKLQNTPDYFRQLNLWLQQQKPASSYLIAGNPYRPGDPQTAYGKRGANLTLLQPQRPTTPSLPTSYLPKLLLPTLNATEVNRAAFAQAKLYIFFNQGLIKNLPSQQKFVKFALGYPFDWVDITLEGLFINGIFIKELPLEISQALEQLPWQKRRLYLQADQYWFAGDTLESIDSLYFGAVNAKLIFSGVFYAH
ncbi:S26 family signal peptidase [Psittacicella gerlachiana]|uniref:Peptidase S26 domain-containing protein n=1 Tax=Psittacicella gerlachiana TaxID=2028574 RepID=A0A3A1YFJ2_9GAMM|nr:S26 family signal peptidase [Psittacicella gerlachiana]RIY35870.1 hypothetical protein CKF59_03155 [Psittacicella gerlachiana]